MVYAERAASGTFAIRGHHPQHHVVGYFGRNDYGASQFSHWGPASELMVDWTTENYHGTHAISVLVVTRFVVDAPVATLPGARAYGVTPIVPTAALH